MTAKFQVTIFKKSKKAPYPDHIVVKGFPSKIDPYNNLVHLYFDKGVLSKFTHIQNAPKGKRIWDPQAERYVDLEPKHRIAQEFTIKNGKKTYSQEPIHTAGDFIVMFGYIDPDIHTITFCQGSLLLPRYYEIITDSRIKWREPNDYLKHSNKMAAVIEEIYSEKKDKISTQKLSPLKKKSKTK